MASSSVAQCMLIPDCCTACLSRCITLPMASRDPWHRAWHVQLDTSSSRTQSLIPIHKHCSLCSELSCITSCSTMNAEVSSSQTKNNTATLNSQLAPTLDYQATASLQWTLMQETTRQEYAKAAGFTAGASSLQVVKVEAGGGGHSDKRQKTVGQQVCGNCFCPQPVIYVTSLVGCVQELFWLMDYSCFPRAASMT